jgi:transcription initiation factor TFIIB
MTRESVGTTFQPTPGEDSAWILRRYNDRLEYSVRALKDGLREVRSLCSACDLPGQVRQRAAWLYRRAAARDLLHGRSRDGIAAACVYAAARDGEHPVTLDEVATVSPVDKQRISNDYRTVVHELGIELNPPNPEQFLAKVASGVGVPFAVQRHAAALLDAARAEGHHVGQSPSGVAAAALYLAADRRSVSVTQQEVADAAGVSAATISRQVKTLRELSDPVETERHPVRR